ncbi:hypothetical protein [Mycoplasmopsis primatum]|uniref:hypothetical protein n=1 Tax=Mycoplasmopsis primatum TaxID=55604 RepID=UPI0004952151|nr:hypothetical protein [Mycoplasmopsis primatum]
MNKSFKSYIIQSLIDCSILIIFYTVAFALLVSRKPLFQDTATIVTATVGITLSIQLLIAYFTSVYGEKRGTKALNLALTITLILFIVGTLISLIYVICALANANLGDGWLAFSICTACFGMVLTLPYFIVSIIFAIRHNNK